jgi:regulator of protease activity HflC (stomatin/prohibitin superfamily)
VADATARAVERVAAAAAKPGGIEAVNLRVAERYVDAFAELARTNNTLIIPSNFGDLSGLIATAMTVVKRLPVPEGTSTQTSGPVRHG